MIRAAVIAVLTFLSALTGGVAVELSRPKPVQQVIVQPVHTVERIVERDRLKDIHTAAGKIRVTPRNLQAGVKPAPLHGKPALGKRYPGDDSANELNLRELR